MKQIIKKVITAEKGLVIFFLLAVCIITPM